MRTRIAVLLLLLPLAAWSQEPASPEPPDPMAYRHRGFYFHLESGAGYFRSANETGSASNQVLSSAQSLADDSSRLKLEVGKFLEAVRAA